MESKFEKLCENTVQTDKAKKRHDLVNIKGVYANPTQDAFLIAKDLCDRTGSNGPEAGASWVEVLKRLHFAGYTIVKR